MSKKHSRSLFRLVTLRIGMVLAMALLACGEAFGDPLDDTQKVFVSPALPTTKDRIVLEITFHCGLRIMPPVLSGNTIIVAVDSFLPPPPCPPPEIFTSLLQFSLPQLAPGSYAVQQIVHGIASPETLAFQVAKPATSFSLLGSHFAVTGNFSPSQGPAATAILLPASGAQLSDESCYLWFFDANNAEVLVKILDGRPVNGHYWVFISSATSVAFWVIVTDLRFPAGCQLSGNCLSKTYTNAVSSVIVDLNYWADFP
jgi:hypothetical protein